MASTNGNHGERATYHPLVAVTPTDILDRWANGDTLNKIAEVYQVTPAAVTRWLQRNASKEDIETARELHYQTKLDTGLERIEQAEDDVNLARAREAYLRRLEWRAKTECQRWQDKPMTAVQINGGAEMSVQIVSYAQHTAPLIPSPEQDSSDATP